MPARAKSRRNFSFGTTQYSAALGGTYKTDRERKKRLAEQKREDQRDRIAAKKLAAQERAADAKLKALDKKIETAEKKITASEKKVDKGALTESGFEAIKARMEREIEKQEEHKKAVLAKNPRLANPGGSGHRSPARSTASSRTEQTPNPRYWEEDNTLTEAQKAVQFWESQMKDFSETLKKDYAAGHPDKQYSRKLNQQWMFARKRYAQAVRRLNAVAKAQGKRKIVLHVDTEHMNSARARSAALMGTAGGSGRRSSARSSSLRNPEPAQDDGSEEYKQAAHTAALFHGRPVKEEISVTESIKEHDWYVSIGPLIKLKIRTLTKRNATLPFARKGEGRVELLCSPDGRQFYLRGGDQQLDLKPLGMGPGTEWYRDHMVIGECKEITYQDSKKFHKFAPVDYFHKLGEVTKKKPALMYDTLAGKLSIVGGQYKIEMEDLVDSMSPGIVN